MNTPNVFAQVHSFEDSGLIQAISIQDWHDKRSLKVYPDFYPGIIGIGIILVRFIRDQNVGVSCRILRSCWI